MERQWNNHNHIENHRAYCSKPPSENELPKKKFSFSGKSFTSRMKKRSLDPSTRISAMMPLEGENVPKNTTNVSGSNTTSENPKRTLRRLAPEERLQSMIDENSDDKGNK